MGAGDARVGGGEYLLYLQEAGGWSDPLFVSGVFRRLRAATRGAAP